MRVFNVVLIGAVLGALDGVGIFFEPKEPYKWQILGAATLKGILAALGYRVLASCHYAVVGGCRHWNVLWSGNELGCLLG
jgi:hypothetical protein